MASRPNSCRLGCGEHRVLAMSRCCDIVICEMDSVASLDYQRVMDDTSEAKFTVSVKGAGENPCCECLGGLRSWMHNIVIERDGEIAWGPGPIVNLLYRSETVVVTARDVSAWLDKRKIHNDYNFVQVSAVEVARTIIEDALSIEDPCGLLDYLVIEDPADKGLEPVLIDKEIKAADDIKAGEVLRELARTVIDFTVVGLSIIIGQRLEYGPFGVWTDQHFQTELEVEERGLEAATKWYVHGNDDTVRGEAGGTDEDTKYFGLLEDVADEENVTSVDQANAAAANRLEASNPAPVYINIPDGAQLSPKTPICFNQLVPGALVDVALLNICRDVAQTNRLTGVRVTVRGDGNEAVQVSLTPSGTNYTDGVQT